MSQFDEIYRNLKPYMLGMVQQAINERVNIAPVSAPGTITETSSLELNRIVLLHPGGSAAFYEVDGTGLDAASAAANSRDVIWIPAVTITGDHTLTAGVEYWGAGRKVTVLAGTITLGNGSVLRNCSVARSANDANPLYGIIGPSGATDKAFLFNVEAQVDQAGTGNAYGLWLGEGDVEAWGCDLAATSIGGQGFGLYNTGVSTGIVEEWRSFDGRVTVSEVGQNCSDCDCVFVLNPERPLLPDGDCLSQGTNECNDTDPPIEYPVGEFALLFSGPAGLDNQTWVIYDLGGVWDFDANTLQVRMYWDADGWIDVSEDGINWQNIWLARTTWAAATCAVVNIGHAAFSARYIKFGNSRILLVGNHMRLAWFAWRGVYHGYAQTGRYYHCRFYGSYRDVEATNAGVQVYACQYTTKAGHIEQLWGDRSAWDVLHYGPRHSSDWDTGDSHHKTVTLDSYTQTINAFSITDEDQVLKFARFASNHFLATSLDYGGDPSSGGGSYPEFRFIGMNDLPVDALTKRLVYIFPELIEVTTGATRFYNTFDYPFAVVGVHLSVNTPPTTSPIIVDVNLNGASIFTNQSDRPRIAAGEYTGGITIPMHWPAPGNSYNLCDDNIWWKANNYITVDVDQIGSGYAGYELVVQVLVNRYVEIESCLT